MTKLVYPGGRLSFIVTNKWMKAGYGEPLRRFFSENAWMDSVIDFGHAKQIFEEADVFPGIVVIRKPTQCVPPTVARVCAIARDQLRIDNLSEQIRAEGFDIPRDRLKGGPWLLEPPAASDLLEKIRQVGIPLKDFAQVRPLFGIKTGLNEAFLLDTPTKNCLVTADPRSVEILKPYLRGQDVRRWGADWAGLWMIVLKSSSDHEWPWSDAGEHAEEVLAKTYRAVHAHLDSHRDKLIHRQDQGRYWWELRTCAYWDKFEKPKVMYQDITWQAQFCMDSGGMLTNNTMYFLPSEDLWLLAALNSPIAWWFASRKAQHGKDEALRFFGEFMEAFPIPFPTDKQRSTGEAAVSRLIEIAKSRQATRRDLLDWLNVEYGIEKPSQKLQRLLEMDAHAFVSEVKKLRGKKRPLTVAALKVLRDEHAGSIEPTRRLADEANAWEKRVSDQVNAAFGLTSEEVAPMWRTAPPRMPLTGS